MTNEQILDNLVENHKLTYKQEKSVRSVMDTDYWLFDATSEELLNQFSLLVAHLDK